MVDISPILDLWILLTVTPEGITSTASLPTKAACEDAKSLILTGMTVAEKMASDKKEEDRLKQWYRDHKPREPISDDERKLVKEKQKNIIISIT
jgi:hypothetical protein